MDGTELGVIADLWAEGLTQQEIADRLGMSHSKLRYRVARAGYRFGRAGRMFVRQPIPIVRTETRTEQSAKS